jgi:signal peptidase I
MPPARWKVVAFARGRKSFPYVGRLAGMPGETIFIKDGAVWVNGIRQEPPADIVPVRYSENLPPRLLAAEPVLQRPARTHGYAHPDEPLVLKGDEYFLLNDNPLDFVDGRNSGPLHGSDYLGVVEVIYWPPRRWGLVR